MADESGYESPPSGGVTEPSTQVHGMAQIRAEVREREREERRGEERARFREESINKAIMKHGRITYLAKRELGEFRR
tara:strand:- start:187 stop:417 length:231 start_codon:yes stop_codon:yes gene_type:complete